MEIRKIQSCSYQSKTYITNYQSNDNRQYIFSPNVQVNLNVNVQPSIDYVQAIKYALNRLKRIIDAFRRI